MSRKRNSAGAVDRRGHGSARKSGATATATVRTRDVEDRGPSIRSRYVVGNVAHKLEVEPQPKSRRRTAEPEEARRHKTKAAPRPKRRLLSGVYGGMAAFVLLAGIAGVLLVSSKVMIAGTQFKAEMARVELQRSKALRDQLAAKYTVMAASPEIQRLAMKKLKMVTPSPENIVFLGPEPSPAKLEKALKRLDKKGWKVKSYKRWLAAEKKARAKAAREARLRASAPAAPTPAVTAAATNTSGSASSATSGGDTSGGASSATTSNGAPETGQPSAVQQPAAPAAPYQPDIEDQAAETSPAP